MKLLVFAHTPPPLHGQSAMIRIMLDGFGDDQKNAPNPSGPIQCFHVNCRLSSDLEEIGKVHGGKVFQLLKYCVQAIRLRLARGVSTFYFVPAPGKRAALYRDWMILTLCRPFFGKMICHWHAAGLADWLATEGRWWERKITKFLFSGMHLGIALTEWGARDPLAFHTRKVAVVPNGIEDPCPDFASRQLPRRSDRFRQLQAQRASGEPACLNLLFLAHCSREKGLFDALEGVALFNRRHPRLQARLRVAGTFPKPEEEALFQRRIAQPDLEGAVEYLGFLEGDAKNAALAESDALLFPTFYPAESFGLVLVEAMALGVPAVTTRWRAIPEIMPPDYPLFVEINAPETIADALEKLAEADLAQPLRHHFEERFTLSRHLEALKNAICSIE